MTIKQIEKKKAANMAKIEAKFEAAKKIREILDATRKAYGEDDWDSEDVETAVLELVTDEE